MIYHNTFQFLVPDSNSHIPVFYLLFRIHKPNPPSRPITAECGSPTDHLSAFTDLNLKPIITTLPSFIKDTNHILRAILDIQPPIENIFLATMDVKSLHTNIPIEEDIEASMQALKIYYSNYWPLVPVIFQLF